MMNRLLILLGAVLMSATTLFSQGVDLELGTPYQVIDAKNKEYIGLDDGTCVMVKTHGQRVFVQTYDANGMRELERNEYEDFPPYLKFEQLEMINGKISYFFSSYDKKSKTFSLYVREIDPGTGKFDKSRKLLTTDGPAINKRFTNLFSAGQALPDDAGFFTIYPTADGSKFLAVYKRKPLNRKNSENKDLLGFYVYNSSDYSEVWGGEVTMPYFEDQMMINTYYCMNNGEVNLLGKKMEGSFFMLNYQSTSDSKEIELDIPTEFFFQEFRLAEGKDGLLQCIGLYAAGLDFKMTWGGSSLAFNSNGVYSAVIDPVNGVQKSSEYEFPIDLVTQYLDDRQREKLEKRDQNEGKAGIEDLKLKQFIPMADGGALLVAEQDYIRQEMYRTSTENIRHFESMVVMRLDAAGDISWVRKLPKRQTVLASNPKHGCGFKAVESNGKHIILFVDNVKNKDISADELPARHSDGAGGWLMAFIVDDATGNWEREVITDLDDIKGTEAHQFQISRTFQVTENDFLLEMYIKGKKDNMVKFTVK